MKKLKYIFSGIVIGALFLFGTSAAASVLQGFQGGTGIGITSSTNNGYCLQVASTTPFLTYAFSPCGNSVATTTINGVSGPAFTFNTLSGGLSYSTSTGTINLTQAISSASQNGFLLGTDWTTFNNKQATITAGSNIVLTGASVAVTSTPSFASISNTGGYVQSGTSANTFTGMPTFSNATYSALFTGGNVGIGTTIPATLLDVNGSSAIRGQQYFPALGSSGALVLTTNGLVATSTYIASNTGNWAGTLQLLNPTTSSTATSIVARDGNQNAFANNFISGGTSFPTNGGSISLTSASPRSWIFTGTQTQTVKLPNATTLTVGAMFYMNDNSTGNLTVQDFASTTLYTIISGGSTHFTLTSNSTSAGVWDYHSLTPSNATWGSAGLTVSGNVTSTNLTVTGVTSALGLFGSGGSVSGYTGSTNPCAANQAPTTLTSGGVLGGCTATFLTSALTSFNGSTGPTINYNVISGNTLATTSVASSGGNSTTTLTVNPTLATSSFAFVISNATTTNNTSSYMEWIAPTAGTLTNILCKDSVGTTTITFFEPTAYATTTVSSTISSALACGTASNSSTLSTAFSINTPFIVEVTSTIGSPVATPVQIIYTKL